MCCCDPWVRLPMRSHHPYSATHACEMTWCLGPRRSWAIVAEQISHVPGVRRNIFLSPGDATSLVSLETLPLAAPSYQLFSVTGSCRSQRRKISNSLDHSFWQRLSLSLSRAAARLRKRWLFGEGSFAPRHTLGRFGQVILTVASARVYREPARLARFVVGLFRWFDWPIYHGGRNRRKTWWRRRPRSWSCDVQMDTVEATGTIFGCYFSQELLLLHYFLRWANTFQ